MAREKHRRILNFFYSLWDFSFLLIWFTLIDNQSKNNDLIPELWADTGYTESGFFFFLFCFFHGICETIVLCYHWFEKSIKSCGIDILIWYQLEAVCVRILSVHFPWMYFVPFNSETAGEKVIKNLTLDIKWGKLPVSFVEGNYLLINMIIN